MTTRGRIEVGVALGFALLGAYFIFEGLNMGIGTARQMQAGFYPVCIGIVAMAVGLAIAVIHRRNADPIETPDWRAMVAVLAATAAFIPVTLTLGLIPGVAATILVSALGAGSIRRLDIALLSIGVAIVSWLIFVKGLGVPIAGIKGLF